MNETELRELDAWIAEHVFQRKTRASIEPGESSQVFLDEKLGWSKAANYTTDPAAAMQVLEKCAEKVDQISITQCGEWGLCEGDGNHAAPVVEAVAETLPLAICQFAKQLFTK